VLAVGLGDETGSTDPARAEVVGPSEAEGVGTELVGTELVGTELVGTELVGTGVADDESEELGDGVGEVEALLGDALGLAEGDEPGVLGQVGGRAGSPVCALATIGVSRPATRTALPTRAAPPHRRRMILWLDRFEEPRFIGLP
jgi:hypothetical protein